MKVVSKIKYVGQFSNMFRFLTVSHNSPLYKEDASQGEISERRFLWEQVANGHKRLCGNQEAIERRSY